MLKKALSDLISLLFPSLCNGCGQTLYQGEQHICTNCMFDLSFTDFHLFADNRVAKQFWGRLPIRAATAMLYFKKAGVVQNLVHALKYKNKTTLAVYMGGLLGTKLIPGEAYAQADLIIPVPLHPRRLKQRGYNQSYHIGIGVAEAMKKDIDDKLLFRQLPTATQTRKSRYARYENMQEVFAVTDPDAIKGRNILLVDDVVTTGATLEACGNTLIGCGAASICIAALAFTE